MGSDPRQHDGRADGLGDVVHGPEFQPLGFIAHFGLGGQEDDGDVTRGGIGLESSADLIAVHFRHHDIEQNQVRGGIRAGDSQRALTAVGDFDLVFVLEQAAHQCQVVRDIVNHQHTGLVTESR